MKKEDFQGWVEAIFEKKRELATQRQALLDEFKKEYPARKESKGYFLTGTICGKKGCTECPHSLSWRFYARKERKVTWQKKRFAKLPPSFWNSKRKESVYDRFAYYDRRMQELNKKWKQLQKYITNSYKTLKNSAPYWQKF
jgi:hypothetical protein